MWRSICISGLLLSPGTRTLLAAAALQSRNATGFSKMKLKYRMLPPEKE